MPLSPPARPGAPVFPLGHLSAALAQVTATSGERPHKPHAAAPPSALGHSWDLASFTCTVTMCILWLIFHYLISKKPILLVFYMKKYCRS